MQGAELIARVLETAGIQHLFGVAGSSNLDILQTIGATRLRYVSVRHEQVAASMADGYARVGGRPGVAMGQVTGGATNLLTGVAIAYRDGVPLVVFTANESFERIQREAWQTLDVLPMYQPVTKWTRRITQPSEIPHLLFGALARCVSGAPGPVHLDLCRNVTRAEVDQATCDRALRLAEGLQPMLVPLERPRPSEESLDRAARLLAEGRRIAVAAGGGASWSGAGEQVLALAERLGAVVLLGFGARGLVDEEHPLCLGPAGRHGTPAADRALREADVILAVGSRLSDIWTRGWTSISPAARIIHLNVVAEEMARQFPMDVALVGDARAGLEALLERVEPPPAPVLDERRRWVAERKQEHDANFAEFYAPRSEERVLPPHVALAVRNTFPEDAIFTHGSGMHSHFGARLRARRPRTSLKSTGTGSMGFAFPAALGAKVRWPERSVVALVGDGDFAMVCQDLETAVRERLNVVVVVFNNFAYMAEKMRGGQLDPSVFGADHGNPDFALLAQAFGAAGRRIERGDEVEEALAWAARQNRPTVLDVIVDRTVQPLWMTQA